MAGATWIGGGSLLLPQDITLESLRGTIVEQGPLFVKYRLLYTFHSYIFNCNRTWQVDLTVQHNEKHVLVDESAQRIQSRRCGVLEALVPTRGWSQTPGW